jgi:hypothetical protein
MAEDLFCHECPSDSLLPTCLKNHPRAAGQSSRPADPHANAHDCPSYWSSAECGLAHHPMDRDRVDSNTIPDRLQTETYALLTTLQIQDI